MADVFISYKREDRATANRLAMALEQLGFDVWWDLDLLAGDKYRTVIREVINRSSVAVVLWSKRSVESDFVLDEATHAKTRDKLCPARIDEAEIPLGFGQLHTNDLRGWNGEQAHAGFQLLVRAIESRVGRQARLGAVRETDSQEELEAFKAAQLSGSASALETFLRAYPKSALAGFVRSQVASVVARAPQVAASMSAAAGTAYVRGKQALNERTRRAPSEPEIVEPPPVVKRGAPIALIAIALLAVLCGVGYGAYTLWPRLAPAFEPVSIAATEPGAQAPTLTVETPATATQAGVQPASTSPSTPRADAYSIARYGQHLRETVERARAMRGAAETEARRARDLTAGAETAARRARQGEPGTRVRDMPGYGLFEGIWPEPGQPGLGVLTLASGDRYVGQWDGAMSGLGVRTAENGDRYEGQFAHNELSGLGLVRTRQQLEIGEFQRSQLNGAGVITNVGGDALLEGNFMDGRPERYAIQWNSDGAVRSAGYWTTGGLTHVEQPLAD